MSNKITYYRPSGSTIQLADTPEMAEFAKEQGFNVDEDKVAEVAAPAALDATAPAKELAKRHNINIDDIEGTGKNGTVTKEDVKKLIPDEE